MTRPKLGRLPVLHVGAQQLRCDKSFIVEESVWFRDGQERPPSNSRSIPSNGSRWFIDLWNSWSLCETLHCPSYNSPRPCSNMSFVHCDTIQNTMLLSQPFSRYSRDSLVVQIRTSWLRLRVRSFDRRCFEHMARCVKVQCIFCDEITQRLAWELSCYELEQATSCCSVTDLVRVGW